MFFGPKMPNEESTLFNSHDQSYIRQHKEHGGMVARWLFLGSAGSRTWLWAAVGLRPRDDGTEMACASVPVPGSRACWLMGTGWGDAVTHREADAVLLWCLRLKPLAEAAVPEPTLEEDTGNEETHPLSPVFTGTETRECVFVHASVCLSFLRTDWLTVDPADVCMISPILAYESSISQGQRKVTGRKWWPVWMNWTDRIAARGHLSLAL